MGRKKGGNKCNIVRRPLVAVIYTAIHLQSEEEQRLYGAEDNMMARFLIHFLSLSASVPPREEACWAPVE